ncbi:MAG TPA: PaaI family thioesterase [Thermoanaerobaculia bacterium]|nr:PaaI family thioesterase [Thermoanaerobaculia bacterium]
MPFEPAVRDWEERVRRTFAGQALMATLGAALTGVAPGEIEIEFPFRPELTQQHGYLHAGVVTAVADTACGAAAFTLMPEGAAVLSVEYKVNLLAPARGDRFRATGRVLRPGRTLTVCAGDVVAIAADGGETPVATMLATMMTLLGRGISG